MYVLSAFVSFLLLTFIQAQGDFFRPHYEAAQAYQRDGNFGAAEAEFNIVLGEAYHRLGNVYSAESNYERSLEALQSACKLQPKSARLLVDLSIAYFHLGRYSEGVTPPQSAIPEDSRNVQAHHMLGKTYFMMGNFENAKSELLTTLQLSP